VPAKLLLLRVLEETFVLRDLEGIYRAGGTKILV